MTKVTRDHNQCHQGCACNKEARELLAEMNREYKERCHAGLDMETGKFHLVLTKGHSPDRCRRLAHKNGRHFPDCGGGLSYNGKKWMEKDWRHEFQLLEKSGQIWGVDPAEAKKEPCVCTDCDEGKPW